MPDSLIEILRPISLLFYLFAYLIAAVPTSYLVAKWLHGINIRQQVGHSHTANYIYRTLSKNSGLLVFVLDLMKGLLPCAIAHSLNLPVLVIAVIGFFAVVGHCFSFWLSFAGGHGGATLAGAMLMISWPAALIILLVNVLLVWKGTNAGIASIAAALTGISVLFFTLANKMVWLIVFAIVAVIAIRHRTSISIIR